MLRELFISVASGLIVALVLGLFRRGGRRGGHSGGMREASLSQAARYNPPPRRGGLLGGVVRLVLAVGGGIAIAYAAAPLVLGRHFGHGGGYHGRFDRFDGYGNVAGHAPMIVLTVLGTALVWGLLAALTRR